MFLLIRFMGWCFRAVIVGIALAGIVAWMTMAYLGGVLIRLGYEIADYRQEKANARSHSEQGRAAGADPGEPGQAS